MFGSLGIKTKIGLGVILSYSSYALYVSYAANTEITRRARFDKLRREQQAASSRLLEQKHDVCDDDCPDKYSSLTVAGRFENPFEEYRMQSLFEFFLTRILELWEGKSRGGVPDSAKLRDLLPVFKPDLELLKATSLLEQDKTAIEQLGGVPKLKDRLTFTWLGQSCAFIQISGVNILTDPLFADYLVNPYLGPKRITPSPCELKELPKPHFVLVSHNHPDHLDMDVVDELRNTTTWIVPLGLRKFLAKKGIVNTVEMDWWDRVTIPVPEDPSNVYEVACTPAMHWSGRQLWDSNATLWCSFLVLKNGKPVLFHAGDTGYVDDLFTKIAETFGNGTKLAMLPCGQYCPQWHQKPRHINPMECVKIMDDMRAKKILGVHWGTFVLSSEHFLEPKLKLEELAKNLNKANDILAPQFGKTMVFDMSYEGDNSSYTAIRDGKSVLIQ